MPSPQQDIEPLSKQLTIIIGLTVVGFMAFGLALSFYRNILFETTLQELEQQNKHIADDINQGYRNLEYYRSDQFKDKFAKENLSKLNKGEKVLLISQLPKSGVSDTQDSAADQESRDAAYFELLRQMPVLDHWKLFLFHRDKLEGLRKGV